MRPIIISMVFILLVADVGFLLAGSVQYMYSKDKFDWTATTFSNYREVLLDFAPEMELFYMLFTRWHAKNTTKEISQTPYGINFRSKIQLGNPVFTSERSSRSQWPVLTRFAVRRRMGRCVLGNFIELGEIELMEAFRRKNKVRT